VVSSRSRKKTVPKGSLVVVGAGINGVGQTTLEAVECMRRAERLFYSVVDPITEQWILELNSTAVSLAGLYADGKPRSKTYAEMTRAIVSAVTGGNRVCVVFYGHPGVLVESTHTAIARLRRAGYSARMRPGVSAEACLYADLGLNPGEVGIQSFEATDFLLSRRRWDPTSGLILWQVGVLGLADSRVGNTCYPERLRVLVNALLRRYPASHPVVIYYAATFPANPPVIERVSLRGLARARIKPMALLYVPPARQRTSLDRRVLGWLTD
jgi:precorrin-6B methylase 1